MNIDVICAFRTLRSFEEEWITSYVKRLKPFAKVKFTHIKEQTRRTERETAEATWAALEKRIPEKAWRIVLHDRGTAVTTKAFADLFDQIERSGRNRMSFILGGSYGLPSKAVTSADTCLSLTPLTLPHRLALLVLVEQLYRVMSWRAGSPYHHT